MELKKHNDELATRMSVLDAISDSQLAREFIELYEKKCKECQEDRLSCTVRPACKNRNFLNMLIELGVDPQDLPSFCYTQYLEQIKRFVLERKGRGMVDRRLPIKDLLSTLRVSSIKHFLSRFKKIWSKSAAVQDEDYMLVAGDDLLFQFNFGRGIVIVNPTHHRIKNYQVFQLYVELLSEIYDIEFELSGITMNWWVLELHVDGASLGKNAQTKFETLTELFEEIHFESDDSSARIEAEIVTDVDKPTFEVGHLRKLFNLVSEIT